MLTSPYRPELAWWEAVLIFQRLVIVATATFITDNVLRLLLLMFVSGATLCAHAALRPYPAIPSELCIAASARDCRCQSAASDSSLQRL